LGSAGPHLPWEERNWSLKHITTHICYHAEFGRSRSNRRGPKISGTLGPCPCDVAWRTLYNHTPPHMSYHAEFGRSRSNGMNVIKEIRLKNFTPRVPPFNVTQCNRVTLIDLKKQEWWGYQADILRHFDTLHECDGQINKRTLADGLYTVPHYA